MFLGLVDCVGARGIGLGDWGVVLGLGGSVLGSRGVVLGLGVMVLGRGVLVFWGSQVGGLGSLVRLVVLGHGGLHLGAGGLFWTCFGLVWADFCLSRVVWVVRGGFWGGIGWVRGLIWVGFLDLVGCVVVWRVRFGVWGLGYCFELGQVGFGLVRRGVGLVRRGVGIGCDGFCECGFGGLGWDGLGLRVGRPGFWSRCDVLGCVGLGFERARTQ